MVENNPEIGCSLQTGRFNTNYHDLGSGDDILLIHGSGPGVSAWANWRFTIPYLADSFRVIAPDMVGFGFTDRPDGIEYSMQTWVQHAIDMMDALDIEKTNLVGNSFGAALAVELTLKYPDRVKKLVLMGGVGTGFELTDGLDSTWGYEPSIENMKNLLDIFAYDRSLVTDELAELRYKASIQPGFQEAFSSMFPAPRQRSVDAMAASEEHVKSIEKDTLIIHGREDRVIPLTASYKMHELIPKSQLHVFGQCGHWTQIEHKDRFNKLLFNFFSE